MRELLLVRHGHAEAGPGKADRSRALTDGGKRDMQRMGVYVQSTDCVPKAAFASPALRTRVSAEKLLKASGVGDHELVLDTRIYDAACTDLLGLLSEAPREASPILLVGHNPGLSELASFLTASAMALVPGAMVRMEVPDDWTALAAGCGHLRDFRQPEELPRMFPFPGPGGNEERSRPAYYYRQSGVVPYRKGVHGWEFLLVGSSSRKRWIVPKGVATPGMSLEESAKKEALEEGGVVGTVHGPTLGSLHFTKWGGPVRCEMYAMEVNEVLPDELWEERHRGRRWLEPRQALSKIKNSELREIVERLLERLGPAY